jgi:biotin operon repressor
MSRLRRTLQLQQVEHVTKLLESGPFYTAELATKLGITPRSTNRLLADLRAVGVPIVSTPYGFRMQHHLGERKPLETIPSVPPPSPDAQVERLSGLVEHGIIKPEQAKKLFDSDPWET